MFFHQTKGIIALDIDGTVTAEAHSIDLEVIWTLTQLAHSGWQLIFITGRPFQWGIKTLERLPFSYTLAVQNGALLIEMPSRKILARNYLSKSLLPDMEKISQEFHTDFVIYSGMENEDWCYYRPKLMSSSLLSYVLERTAYLGEKWQSMTDFDDLSISFFSAVKFFTKEDDAINLSQRIENFLDLHAPPNRDPFNDHYYVIQATHPEATKGNILKEFLRLKGEQGPIIAAGDDYNDLSMLKVAQVKVVMSNAPSEILKIADIIAPPATQRGIIEGLNRAISWVYPNNSKS